MIDNNLMLVIGAVALVVMITVYLLRKKGAKRMVDAKTLERESSELYETMIDDEDIKKVEDEIRLLEVEREIVDYAISHLYEAESEGKISEEERKKLVEKYRNQMIELDTKIERDQLIKNLHAMVRHEGMPKEGFVKFLRGTQTTKDIDMKAQGVSSKKSAKSVKSMAEKRIEEIKAEVLKTLEKLEKMDLEG